MNASQVLIISPDPHLYENLIGLFPEEADLLHYSYPQDVPEDLVAEAWPLVVLALVNGEQSRDIVNAVSSRFKARSFVIVVPEDAPFEILNSTLPLEPLAVLPYPSLPAWGRDVIQQALHQNLQRIHRHNWRQDLAETNRRLNLRLQEINTIYTIGKFVVSTLESDEALTRIVDAAVNLTQSEEGFILLREGDKLYLRVARHVNEDLSQRFYQEVSDPIAWQVIRSGRPTMLHRETQIATGYMVRALLYVPLLAPGQGVVGVLGVVNRTKPRRFTENQLFTLSSLADFAAIALENARLFNAVEDERHRLNSILEHAAEAVLVTDPYCRLLLWSHTAEEIFNLTPEARGKPLYRYINHEGLLDLFEAPESESSLIAELTLEDGQIFNAQLTTITNVGRMVVMQNITHLKELDRLKSEFVSTVSHDLRTPLTTVQGYIELLDRVGPLTSMQQSFVDKALNSLNHITDLIGDLLDIGRIEAGYDLEMQPCRLDWVIQQTVDEYRLAAEQSELVLRGELPDEPIWVQGNPRRLRQVFDNLLSNAIKYNRPGGWVNVKVNQNDHYVIVEVVDSGIGIPFEEQPKIFERFYRVQSPQTEEIQGTGLGLAIVKSVIEKHKGRIWVESSPNQGSTFAFVLSTQDKPTPSVTEISQSAETEN